LDIAGFPPLVMTDPGMPGRAESQAARNFWAKDWNGQSFMAWGASDPVFGLDVMQEMHSAIRGCPAPLIIPDGGHFVQEWGEQIARAALAAFGER
jgi:haloalkane dehalogenase